MRPEHINLLACPITNQRLSPKDNSIIEDGRIKEGVLIEPCSGNEYPIIDFIPRFVLVENYAKNFGFEEYSEKAT